ncbi:FAD-binding oxidoreductase [Kribbella antibiotica]|uniref:FAD-binding oxidoreductase n=1 Tax=Kribbella antibiotica TaxID=190195 RepID=A0A4R4ZVI0_9ACTN|nr:FAD-binding oxidoreductase [Kribbella antibiotica]TDD62905.1 FAD-binding oxidoreductase [Kribbella antibiotica]
MPDIKTVQHMKWWGWGVDGVAFSHDDKPSLAPFVQKVIDVDLNAPAEPPMAFEDLAVPASQLSEDLQKALSGALGDEYVVSTDLDRVVHAFGKSLRDLVRIRASDLRRIPDVVVYPADEAQIVAVMDAVLAADAVLIPFGGGSNIAGSLEAPSDETRQVVSLDLGRLNKVLSIDEESGLARIQAGALGPDLEKQLGERGWTMGHFPDSFTHSSLGGWIATRSSGMQSDKFGDIADITRAMRVVQPGGTLATRAVPVTSSGPSVREMILGSEGRLGVITEATVQVHRKPEKRVVIGYFFPDWKRGVAAMQAISASDATPSITRISDSRETQFSFATRKVSKGFSKFMSSALIAVLKRRGWDLEQMCLSFIGYEGSAEHVARQRKLVKKIVAAHGGIGVGEGPGALYDQKKFDTPYIRDFLLDRGALADVSETSASWSHLMPLYDTAVERVQKSFAQLGVKGWVMCHLSHSYHSGACLYFTFAFKAGEGDPVAQYDVVKSAVQQAFMDANGTLSHHHAVGTEHSRWLADDISEPGVQMVSGIFTAVDPGRNLNPGKIVS